MGWDTINIQMVRSANTYGKKGTLTIELSTKSSKGNTYKKRRTLNLFLHEPHGYEFIET